MRGSMLFALCILVHGAGAGKADAVEPIPETALVQVIKVLQGWRSSARPMNAGHDSVSADSEKGVAERTALIQDIQSGTIDPLAWLKEHAPALHVPPLLTYSPECSRMVSGLAMSPTALFSFGIEASEYGLALISPEDNKLPPANRDERAETDAQKKVAGVVNAMRMFYREEKYPYFVNEAPLYWSTVSPDSSVRVTVIEANVYRAWGCDALPTGPLLEIAWNEIPDDSAWRNKVSGVEDLKTILGEAGLSEQEFLSFVTALVIARRDHRNPSLLQFDNNRTPESADEEKLFTEVKRMVEVRKKNAFLYERYMRILDPLLDLFEETGK